MFLGATRYRGRSVLGDPGNMDYQRTWARLQEIFENKPGFTGRYTILKVQVRGPRCLFEDGGKAGKHFVHDGFGNGVDAPPLPSVEIEGARLVTANYTPCPSSSVLERNGEATSAREAAARRDGQNYGYPGQFVERGRGDDKYRSDSLPFVSGTGNRG